MGLGINDVVIMAVSFLLVAILGPIAIGTIANLTATNATGTWNPAVITMFQVLLPILWVIGVAIKYIPKAKGE
jgi:hypothetical protein